MHLARLAQVKLDESRSRADLIANAIYHRAREIVVEGVDPDAALRAGRGLRSIVQSSLYSKNVTFAAIVDVNDVAIVHGFPELEGKKLKAAEDLTALSKL